MNNIEIERKYKIDEAKYCEIIKYLEEKEINVEKNNQNDVYFSPVHFPFLGGEIDNECLRLRILEDKNILSYKKFVEATAEEPAHCIEHEMEITDINNLKLILKDLRINEEFTLKKERISFIYKNHIEIALDKVENLGYFIELEIINQEDVSTSTNNIEEFIKRFGITEEFRNYEGYSYMLYNQKRG